MKTQTRMTLTLAAGLVIGLAMLGCSSDTTEQKGGATSLLKTSTTTINDVASMPNDPIVTGGLQTVYFAQDTWTLDDEAKAIVKKNADWLNDNPPYRLEIDGYADARGTPEQALAMSQRRAAALRDYYAILGLPKSRIATVALGQTNPVCIQDTEDCWKQNRRAETHIETKKLAER